MRARELTEGHIGRKVSYGPNRMFSGRLVVVDRITVDWLESKTFITTADGRSATLAPDEEVSISG